MLKEDLKKDAADSSQEEYYFAKDLATDLGKLPTLYKMIAKHQIRDILFQIQMQVLSNKAG